MKNEYIYAYTYVFIGKSDFDNNATHADTNLSNQILYIYLNIF